MRWINKLRKQLEMNYDLNSLFRNYDSAVTRVHSLRKV